MLLVPEMLVVEEPVLLELLVLVCCRVEVSIRVYRSGCWSQLHFFPTVRRDLPLLPLDGLIDGPPLWVLGNRLWGATLGCSTWLCCWMIRGSSSCLSRGMSVNTLAKISSSEMVRVTVDANRLA